MDKEFYVEGLMDLTPYRLVRGELDERWDRFAATSPQGSIFSRTAFLSALDEHLALWYCLKNEETVGAVVLHESADGRHGLRPPGVIYNGIMFAEPRAQQGPAQVLSEQFRIISAMVRDLTKTYKRLDLFCAPGFTDIRPFLWHNYAGDGLHFSTQVRYTSLLDIHDANAPLGANPVYERANKSRRQEIRYAIKHGVEVDDSLDIDRFENLYRKTFERQNQVVDEPDLARLSALIQSLANADMARMFVARLADGTVGNIAVFGIDGARAYYLYGANAAEGRDNHGGTYVLWRAFQMLNEAGVNEVDLEGVNSPKRGYFKLSFGGALCPYYNLTYPATS
ncbi:GNAT family N-acetyltransferase [Magnetovibrio sp.]|uniref:GNAT family N-acetyltransferase n=1 Tax=Magnetovibrio sp. TaxID=2024836 RepID=UPI002F95C506